MADRMIKPMLVVAIVLLSALLLRPILLGTPSQAQGQPVQGQTYIAADNGTVYVFHKGKIYVYYWDNEETQKLKPKMGTLRLMSTVSAHLEQ